MSVRTRVVVVGSGFGGLNAALRLARQPVDITVVDRDNYHGFWPLLYQVATAGLGSDDIAHPIRNIYGKHPNISVRLGTVTHVDLDDHQVTVYSSGGQHQAQLPYDYLILAAGSSTSDFGIPGVADHAFPLKTIPDAVRLRNHILSTFEAADADPDGGGDGALTTVLIGGGPTGVEMAGALAELIERNLAADFHRLDVGKARVVLIEMSDHLLPGYSARSQRSALETLRRKGVEVRLGARLSKVTATGIVVDDGTTTSELAAATVVWTAGVRANPLGTVLPGDKGSGGRIQVLPDLSLEGHPEVFVIGDLAARPGHDGEPLPQVAQVAIQGGKHTARNIHRLLRGKPSRPFHYLNHGSMATIGRRAAIADLPGGITFTGSVGWFAWLGVHLVFLVGFRNRVVVLVNWAWNYLTWDRATRVILDDGSGRSAEPVTAPAVVPPAPVGGTPRQDR
jgi:NADH:ubiquinone reductase (H+-translocating)